MAAFIAGQRPIRYFVVNVSRFIEQAAGQFVLFRGMVGIRRWDSASSQVMALVKVLGAARAFETGASGMITVIERNKITFLDIQALSDIRR